MSVNETDGDMETENVLMRIFMHPAALGASDGDGLLERVLREIAIAASPDPAGEWAEKYGTDVDNAVMMMHPYCWCERDDCPWCGGCTCPEEAYRYYIDDEEVDREQYIVMRNRAMPPHLSDICGCDMPRCLAYDDWRADQIKELNRRFRIDHVPSCKFCTDGYKEFGGEPGRGAPNFWYKATGLKVWWYKYIGMDMEVVGPTDGLDEVLAACKASLQ